MRSPRQDVSRTLRALPESFSRLIYLASLRDAAGNYHHWGLAKEYGQDRMQAAFEQAHQFTYESLLNKELSEVLLFLNECCRRNGRASEEVLIQLLCDRAVKPACIAEPSAMHFNYVLESVLALAQSKRQLTAGSL